jgi:transketolase
MKSNDLSSGEQQVTENAAGEDRLDQQCINAIRFLSADAVQKANSGHPGAPMGAAAFCYVLWDRHLRHNPANPNWIDRDRFLLSAGHASMLLYSLLHLTGYDLSLDEIKNFRQYGSKTPGHPEYGQTPGVEVTTGPLGQGFGNGIGMAIAQRHLAAVYNRPGHNIIDHHIYAMVSDGDLQEGISSEAASLAGTLGLGNVIYLYDDNSIQIEGSTSGVFNENVGDRFKSYGWHVVGPIDGNDLSAVDMALQEARADSKRPSLIICRTEIGYGSPRANSAKAHGEPLGEENVAAAKDKLNWPEKPSFHVPDEVYSHMRRARERGASIEAEWEHRFDQYAQEYPDLAAELQRQMKGQLPAGWEDTLNGLFDSMDKPLATRAASGKVLNALAPIVTALMGGSADLGPSNKTQLNDIPQFTRDDPAGRNLRFGVREHAMAAIASGMALYGGVIPYTGTFLTFADYMRPSMRLAALMGLRVIYVFSHDSIGLGEDGPTHQPIEHLMSLRCIPNMTVIRPADAPETLEAWKAAISKIDGPTALVLTRQSVPIIDRTGEAKADGLHKGAYTLWQSDDAIPDVILIGTGSETTLALEAGRTLAADGIKVRVVSMPSWELFDRQDVAYRESVLPAEITARVAVEAGITFGWERVVGTCGRVVGMTTFGHSAPYKELYEKFGITAAKVVEEARRLLSK